MADDAQLQRLKAAFQTLQERYTILSSAVARQTQHADLLDRIRTLLGRESNLQVIYRTVVEAIAETFGYTHVCIYLVEGGTLCLQHQVGYERGLPAIPLGRGVTGMVVRTGAPALIPDVSAEPLFISTADDIVSEVCVPLIADERIVGVLNIESTRGIELTTTDLRLMVAISEHIGIAVSRAHLYNAVRESEERYRRLVEMSPDAIVVHREGKIAYVNQAACQLIGARDPEELVGQPVFRFVPPHYREIVRERQQRIAATQEIELIEEQFLRLDNTLVDVEVAGIPTTYLGKPAVQLVIRDITERRRAESQRLLIERKLAETQKMESLGILAGGIAHDFNNLLMAIVGNAALARLDLAGDSPASEAVLEIETIARRAADLTQQMLSYAGRGHFMIQPNSLNTIISEMDDLLQAAAPKGVALQLQLDPDLPLANVDVSQMRQVLINLVSNAGEALGDQPGTITVRTRTLAAAAPPPTVDAAPPLAAGTYVVLEVSDSGHGMDPATMAKVFEPFFTTKFIGRGLGLAVVLGIVRGHQGSIHLSSHPERGTVCTVMLPPTPAPAPAARPLEKMTPNSDQALILLVDDEASVRMAAERVLTRLGFRVIACADGQTAVEAYDARQREINCVLLDLTMPRMNGEETFHALRAINPQVRIVLMSGYSEADATGRFGDGLAGFLQKPFKISELQATLNQAIGHSAVA